MEEVSYSFSNQRYCSRSILCTLSMTLSYFALTVSGMSVFRKSSSTVCLNTLILIESFRHAAVRRCSLQNPRCVLTSPCHRILLQQYTLRHVLNVTLMATAVMIAVVAMPLDQHNLICSHRLPLEDLLDAVHVVLLVDSA